MVVQYKGRPCYLCNYLRQQYQVPVCQNLPADPIDVQVVQAFLQALSPVELDLYGKAVAALCQDEAQVQQAQQQQIERLRYQTRLAERQYHQADPDNRLVAAELERRWEAALRDLKDAEAKFQREQQQPRTPEILSPEERAAFLEAGKKIPELWRQGRLTPHAAEGLPPLPHRQGGRASLRSRHSPGPHCLERGRRHRRCPAGDGGRWPACPRLR